MFMRTMFTVILLATLAAAQQTTTLRPNAPDLTPATSSKLIIPSGTKVPLVLKQALSTKNARDGDPVYAQTTFPVVMNDRIVIPAGTYVQGKISNVKRAGRLKGRAEVLMHFTTMIYPGGYTVMLPGALENVPGSEKTSMKDAEGTIRHDSQGGEKAGKAANRGIKGAEGGALAGVLASGSRTGAGVGAGIGGGIGIASALLTRGNDVRLDAGTTLEMVIQRDVPLDANRIPGQRDRFRSASEY
jgi:type IV secretion system protein VirB10